MVEEMESQGLVHQGIDMSNAEDHVTKKGVYKRLKVADVDIPEEFADKFLAFDNKSKAVYFVKMVGVSPIERERREQEKVKRKQKVIERKAIRKQITNIKKQMRRNVTRGISNGSFERQISDLQKKMKA